jgi:hypothetical protein
VHNEINAARAITARSTAPHKSLRCQPLPTSASTPDRDGSRERHRLADGHGVGRGRERRQGRHHRCPTQLSRSAADVSAGKVPNCHFGNQRLRNS